MSRIPTPHAAPTVPTTPTAPTTPTTPTTPNIAAAAGRAVSGTAAVATAEPGTAADWRPRVVVLGDVVLDRDVLGRSDRLAPDAPVPVVEVTEVREIPGGAGLTALAAAASGMAVTLVAPIAGDDAGVRLLGALRRRVSVVPLGHEGPTRTKTRVWSRDHQLLRFDTGGTGRPLGPDLEEVARELAAADVVLVSDYGAGVTRDEGLRALIAEVAGRVPVVWDPHPRGGPPVPGVALVTPNLAEARTAAGRSTPNPGEATPDALADALVVLWEAGAVAVTAGARGAFVAEAGSAVAVVPATAVTGGDPCGAGDRFAASAAAALARGLTPPEAVAAAVADASAWVAGGGTAFREALGYLHGPDGVLGGGLPEELLERVPDRPSPVPEVLTDQGGSGGPGGTPDVQRVLAAVRAAGGTLVATGGCFDLLHAGHVASLRAARSLGDALVVLLNSDESVRRLKGPSRPTVGQDDRARVLAALSDVDAVVVFTEDDPRAALARLQPDVWVKGGDYAGRELPEAALVRSWGGRIVLLPTLPGRSTTALLAARDAGAGAEGADSEGIGAEGVGNRPGSHPASPAAAAAV